MTAVGVLADVGKRCVFKTCATNAAPCAGVGRWVVVVPRGGPQPGQTWRAFFFVAEHVGAFGGHKPAPKTLQGMVRLCWWADMEADVTAFVSRCWQCLQYAKKPQRLPAS